MGPAYRYRATCRRVIDGDTYELDIDLGFRAQVSIEGRLRGVDTPELRGAEREAGLVARQAAIDLLRPATLPGQSPPVLTVESYRDQRSFARWIVDVWLPDGRSLADVLVESGNAQVVA